MLLNETERVLEGLFFIRGEEGISENFLATFLEVEESEAKNILEIFSKQYNEKGTALTVKKFGSVYKMLVHENIHNKIKKVIVSKNLTKLSKSSLETLAIIAYNQPITKVQIDKIRGVSSDAIIYALVNKNLIVSNKTLDTIGKPKLYETTELFLDVFGLESLEKLPQPQDELESEKLKQFLKN